MEDLGGEFDGESPVDGGGTGAVGGGGVDHHDHLRSPPAAALTVGEGQEGMGAEVSVAFQGVVGAAVGDGVGVEGGHGGVQAAVEGEAGFGVEAAGEAPHALPVDPAA